MQKLINQVQKQIDKEKLEAKKVNIKLMLQLIDSKAQAIDKIQKEISKLKRQLGKEDFSPVESEPTCWTLTETDSTL